MSNKTKSTDDENSQPVKQKNSPDENTPSERLPESMGDVADRAEEQIEATVQDKIAEIRRKVNNKDIRIAK